MTTLPGSLFAAQTMITNREIALLSLHILLIKTSSKSTRASVLLFKQTQGRSNE